jgi:hypothetical protein
MADGVILRLKKYGFLMWRRTAGRGFPAAPRAGALLVSEAGRLAIFRARPGLFLDSRRLI